MQSVQFQTEVVAPIARCVRADGLAIVDDTSLQRILEVAGNYLACRPGHETGRLLEVWMRHSVEAMGGS